MDQDIISIFYDDETLGFVFQSDLSEHKYKIQLYNLNGKKTMEQYLDQEFQNIKFSSGKIIVYNADTFCIYSKQGKKMCIRDRFHKEQNHLQRHLLHPYRRAWQV